MFILQVCLHKSDGSDSKNVSDLSEFELNESGKRKKSALVETRALAPFAFPHVRPITYMYTPQALLRYRSSRNGVGVYSALMWHRFDSSAGNGYTIALQHVSEFLVISKNFDQVMWR